tara:strand:- start:4037 stop:4378 length:342 start_codon:yes stop_codon:yes gene_type:complete
MANLAQKTATFFIGTRKEMVEKGLGKWECGFAQIAEFIIGYGFIKDVDDLKYLSMYLTIDALIRPGRLLYQAGYDSIRKKISDESFYKNSTPPGIIGITREILQYYQIFKTNE